MLNLHKIGFAIIGTRQQLQKVNIDQLYIDGSSVAPSNTIKDLGVWFDEHLNMQTHVNNICRSSFYYLYNIRKIRKYLTRQSAEILIHVFVTSRLDYCNSLLYSMPKSLIDKLQRVQNAAARLTTNPHKFCHITPILFDLHWLPINYRIDFKILLLTFKCLNNCAPSYLQELIQVRPQSRYSLRSERNTAVTLGGRAFQCAAPKLWKSLPPSIRSLNSLESFKSAVKTYLFKLAFYKQ